MAMQPFADERLDGQAVGLGGLFGMKNQPCPADGLYRIVAYTAKLPAQGVLSHNNIQDHHQHKADSKANRAEVGVRAGRGFRIIRR